ncbi:MAG: TIGR02587 family membrane protein [Actinomycetota bacterium]|nr:TIGR02587 family membrane protein [Actinomycetota bacterium]
MEVWRLGVSISRWRLVLLIVATMALAVVLSRYFGFAHKQQVGVGEATVDAAVAILSFPSNRGHIHYEEWLCPRRDASSIRSSARARYGS